MTIEAIDCAQRPRFRTAAIRLVLYISRPGRRNQVNTGGCDFDDLTSTAFWVLLQQRDGKF